MSKSRVFTQLILALVLALGAGFMVLKWMGQRSTIVETKIERPVTHPVVVAAKILPPGTKITPEMVKVVEYLEGTVPEMAFADAGEVVDKVLLSPVTANEPITQGRLARDEITLGGVSALITPGNRAMAVKGNRVMGLAGFIRPGNRVDVLTTLEKDPATSESETKLVLENVLVLATGSQVDAGEDGKEPAPVDVYTLEVTPDESERLALAATKGTLHFALRNMIDNSTVLTEGYTVQKTLSALRAQRPARKAAAPKAEFVSEVIAGASRSTVRF